MAEWIAAGVAALSLGYGVYAGETAAAKATTARRRAKASQDEALRLQMIEKQRSAEADAKSNRAVPGSTIAPDVAASATDKTGGVDDRLKLAKPTKLGGGL